MQGSLTNLSYQSIVNQLSKTLNPYTGEWSAIDLSYKCNMPKLASFYKVKEEKDGVALQLGLDQLGGGQCAVVDSELVLCNQIESLVKGTKPPEIVKVQVAADATGYHGHPTDKVMGFHCIIRSNLIVLPTAGFPDNHHHRSAGTKPASA